MTDRKKFATFAVACSLLCVTGLAVDTMSASAATFPVAEVHAATSDPISLTAAAALEAVGTDSFALRLDDVSSAVATRLSVDPALLDAAWAKADRPHQIALLSALSQVGVPYRRNTSKVGVGFDCSGLTAFAWGQAGVELARRSTTQLRNAAARKLDTAQAGDLVYYPGHVMIWLGVDNMIVHAPYRGRPVEVDFVTKRHLKRLKFGNPVAAE
ncbi:MAG TPA: NlpC/P60 family protein [Ilumatobacteraceae bacterium]|jgi:cell wall-associated NlpC family hydrolase